VPRRPDVSPRPDLPPPGGRHPRPVPELLIGLSVFAPYSVVQAFAGPARDAAAERNARALLTLEQTLHLDLQLRLTPGRCGAARHAVGAGELRVRLHLRAQRLPAAGLGVAAPARRPPVGAHVVPVA